VARTFASWNVIGPCLHRIDHVFAALEIPVLAGRTFDARDDASPRSDR
jgi:hypothetical protein